jgi:hypothetical protein
MQDAIWAGCTVGRHWRARRVGCRGGGRPGSRRVRIGAAVQTDGEWSRERAETRGDGRREKKKWIMGITNTQKSMVLLGQSQSSPTDESGVESCARRLNPQRLGNCPVGLRVAATFRQTPNSVPVWHLPDTHRHHADFDRRSSLWSTCILCSVHALLPATRPTCSRTHLKPKIFPSLAACSCLVFVL